VIIVRENSLTSSSTV